MTNENPPSSTTPENTAETHMEELGIEDLEIIEGHEEGDISHEATGASAERRLEWQNMDHVQGEISHFLKNVGVTFDMRLDRDKRKSSPGEDMFLIDKTNTIAGVLDGLGGEGSGDKASSIAAQVFPEAYAQARIETLTAVKEPSSRDALVADFLEGQLSREHPSKRAEKKKEIIARNLPAMVQIEAIIMRKALKAINPEIQKTKGKTTATLGKTVELPDGRQYEVIANIGDSGAFKIRDNGTVDDLTTEDSVVNWLVENGAITAEQATDPNYEVREGETVRSLRRMNTRALGMKEGSELTFEPQIVITKLEPGDRIVYLTDGLRDLDIFRTNERFDPKRVAEVIAKAGGTENLASILNEVAESHESDIKKSGGKAKMDEKTVLIKSRSRARSSTQPPPIPHPKKSTGTKPPPIPFKKNHSSHKDPPPIPKDTK